MARLVLALVALVGIGAVTGVAVESVLHPQPDTVQAGRRWN